jgi:hypothetical protein
MKRNSKGNLVSLKFIGGIFLFFLLFVGAIYFAVHNEGWGTFFCATFFGLGIGVIGHRYIEDEE